MHRNMRKVALVSVALLLPMIAVIFLNRRNSVRTGNAFYPDMNYMDSKENTTIQPDPTWLDLFTSSGYTDILMSGIATTERIYLQNKVVDLAFDDGKPRLEKNLEDGSPSYHDYPLLTMCDLITKVNSLISSNPVNKTLTHHDCRHKCVLSDKIYAVLFRGKCICRNSYQPGLLHNLETCDAVCPHSEPDCDVSKKKHAIVMRAVYRDGDEEWTEWMSFAELNVKTRYRGCKRYKDKDTECTAEYQRAALSSKKQIHPAAESLIGCFTGFSLVKSSLLIKQRKIIDNKGAKDHELCRQFCLNNNSTYALTTTPPLSKSKTRTCYCTDSLAKNQPTNSCTGLGYAAHWTKADQSKQVLKFQGETAKKGKVLILARFRSGFSMTQSLFIRYPNPFILFEPGRMKMSSSPAHTDKAMLMALEAFFSCSVEKLPTFFYHKGYLKWSISLLSTRGQLNNFFNTLQACANARPEVDCAPYWQEACQHSEFMNVKVIRVFDVKAVRRFVERNPDVNMVHLVRDPRGLLSAQQVRGKRPPAAPVCKQMVEAGEMVKEMKNKGAANVHEVHYKDIAVNTSYYAAKLYREMNIEMPKEVIKFVDRDKYDRHIPKDISRVIMSNPEAHVYGFINRYTLQHILEIDRYCGNVYKFWPDHYTDFWTLYKNHTAEVNKYAQEAKKTVIKNYLRKHKSILT